MRDNFVTGYLVSTVISVVFIIFAGVTSCSHERARMRSEAVKHGHAEWVVTGPDGATEFRWKEPPQQGEADASN